MRRLNRSIGLICILALLLSPGFFRSAAAYADQGDAEAAEAPAEAGHAVAFGESGNFTDSLNSLDNVFYESGVAAADGSVTGSGDLYYSAGNDDFQSISVDVTFNKWVFNYTADDLTVYESVYDAGTQTFTDGKQVDMVRELRPNGMANKDVMTATFVSGPITPGTKYLHIAMPKEEFFADAAVASDYKVDEIRLASGQAANKPREMIVDHLSDFSHLASGADTSNWSVNDMRDASRIWDARTFAANYYAERIDATKADNALTYEAPEGKELQSVYVEGYYIFIPSSLFEVWTSEDGTSYMKASAAADYATVPYAYNGDWNPTVLKIDHLPEGTKYVQIRVPGYTSGELWGMKHPRMTQIALGYGDPGTGGTTDPTDPEEPGEPVEYPAETTVPFTSTPVSVDGVVELDGDGNPTGDWAGTQAEHIEGTIDTNGDQHGADVYLQYDYDNLYVGARIKDPTPMINTNTGSNLWGGDNLELFLGTDDLDYTLNPDKKLTMLPTDVQVVLSGGIVGGQTQFYLYENGVFTYPNLTLKVTPDEDGKGYTIEAAIPLSALGIDNPWDDRSIIMNAVLNDGGADKRGQWGWTTNGEATKKSRGLWGLARLEPTDAPPEEISVNAAVLPDTNIVTVTGQTANVASRDVTVLVTDADGIIAYVDQAPSDADGRYGFSFPIDAALFGSGPFTVKVGGDGILHTNSTVLTVAPDTSAPAEAANVRVTEGDGRLTVSWTDPADADYDRALVQAQGAAASPVEAAKGAQQAVLTGLTNGTEYTVVVRTVDLAGNQSQGVEAKGTPRAPGSPPPATVPGDNGGTPGTSVSGVIVIDLQHQTPDANHNVTVELSQEAKAIKLAAGQLALLEDGALIVNKGDVQLSIPAGLLKSAADLSKGDGASIVIQLVSPDTSETSGAVANLNANTGHLTATPFGGAWTIAVTRIAADGTQQTLETFGEPIEIAIPAGAGDMDLELLGRYAYSETTKQLAYAGGHVDSDGSFRAAIAEPGTVQLLTYDKSFPDVPAAHWANRAIQVLTAHHIVNGVSDEAFQPSREITRADFAVLLAKTLGLQANSPSGFADVDPAKYYADAVAALSEALLVSGRGDNRFEPNAAITREEMIALIVRAYEFKTGAKLAEAGGEPFADEDGIAEWARAAADAARAAGLIEGRGNNEFDPAAGSSRADTAQIVYRFLRLIQQD